jgi:hypothetical protein
MARVSFKEEGDLAAATVRIIQQPLYSNSTPWQDFGTEWLICKAESAQTKSKQITLSIHRRVKRERADRRGLVRVTREMYQNRAGKRARRLEVNHPKSQCKSSKRD